MCFKEEVQYLRQTKHYLSRELMACGLQVKTHAPLCLLSPFAVKNCSAPAVELKNC
jgi:hypothetical protein